MPILPGVNFPEGATIRERLSKEEIAARRKKRGRNFLQEIVHSLMSIPRKFIDRIGENLDEKARKILSEEAVLRKRAKRDEGRKIKRTSKELLLHQAGLPMNRPVAIPDSRAELTPEERARIGLDPIELTPVEQRNLDTLNRAGITLDTIKRDEILRRQRRNQ